jgi:hypothetical protein
MEISPDRNEREALAALRRFTRARPAAERCELCGALLGAEHPHLFEQERRRIACACDACAILFCSQQDARYLRVPRRVKWLEDFSFSDEQWDAMMLPIGLAFFLRGRDGATQVLYPSPAGAMESQIHIAPWQELFASEPLLGRIEPEVEALVANRIAKDAAYYIVPVDLCFRLVGVIRMQWRGLSGGGEVWKAIAEFFEDLDRQAGRMKEASHA